MTDAGLITTKKKNNQAVEFKRGWCCWLNLLAWGKKMVTSWLRACELRCTTREKEIHQVEETANLQGPWRNATQRFRWCGVGRRTAGAKWTSDPGMTPEDANTPVTSVSKFPASSAAPFLDLLRRLESFWLKLANQISAIYTSDSTFLFCPLHHCGKLQNTLEKHSGRKPLCPNQSEWLLQLDTHLDL